jgi:hypothetical protein
VNDVDTGSIEAAPNILMRPVADGSSGRTRLHVASSRSH